MVYPTRKIGNTLVSAIGFGAMVVSAFYGATEPDEERFKVLDAALENECTFWDTANIYGDNEILIGKWFKRTGKRDQIFLATKFGLVVDRVTKHGVDGTPENLQKSFRQSLQRLNVSHIDLYYLHRPDPEIPIEVTVGAMAKLVEQGKVTYLGLSECSAETLRRANAIHPIAAVQLEYSPLEFELEKNGVLQTARELGITTIAYCPLGRGLLTGRYISPDDFEKDDFRRSIPRFSAENFPKILKLVQEFQNIGKEHNATASQVSLAWLLAQGEDIIPIPGTKQIKYLAENVAAAHIKLAPEVVQRVRKTAEATGLVGERDSARAAPLLYGSTPTFAEV